MFNSNGQLYVFENFIIDRELLKHRRDTSDESEDGEGNESWGGVVQMSGDSFRVGRPNSKGSSSGGTLREVELTWMQSLLVRLLSWVSPDGKELVWRSLSDPEPLPPEPPTLTVQEFFSSLKDTQEEVQMVAGRAQGYEAALVRARKTGQKALVEQLLAGALAVRSETRLLTLGLTKVLSEETLVEFVKKSPKGLRLDWVKNFTRVIPDEVLDAKVKCDAERVFDNYVVLHYDPERKSWAETHAETEARKDPILFGLIEGRRQLYFVGDWVDEYCDLTLDQIADVLGKESATQAIDPEVFA